MKIFISGPRAVSILYEKYFERIDNIIGQGYEILVGDANGIDKAIQMECKVRQYKNVSVYATNGKARNNLDDWTVTEVNVPKVKKGLIIMPLKIIKWHKIQIMVI